MTIINVAPDSTDSLLTAIGVQADAVATTDTGTATLIALIKRLLSKQPALVNGSTPVVLGASTSAGSVTQSTYSATTTVGNALAANANRKRALILNPSTNAIAVALGFTGTVTATTGVPLQPGRAWLEAFDMTHTGVFSAITASGSATLLVFEWI